MVVRADAWSGVGQRAGAAWGWCQGTATRPYRTLVALEQARQSCSCPSRRAPCKHVTGLLGLLAGGDVPEVGEVPDDVAAWLAAAPVQRARRVPGGAPADPAAAAARAAQRAERVRLGLEELDVWLSDQVRGGLAVLQRGGYGPVDRVAARMVDAQAPGVAGMLRALPSRFVGDDWPARTLEHLAQVRLLVAAHRRLADLPPGLAETVRSRVGYPVAKESVLAGPPVRDRWAALASVDSLDQQLTSRRVWLRGTTTGRWALLLSFAAGGAPLDASVPPGVTIDADLHFYPGSGQLRALVGTEHSRVREVVDLDGVGVTAAAQEFGRLLEQDPWADRMPVVLRGAPVQPTGDTDPWSFRGEDGASVPLPRAAEAWPLLARSMGDPVEVVGEWTRQGFLPLTFLPHPLDPVLSTEVLSA
jgi:hypothetical protein